MLIISEKEIKQHYRMTDAYEDIKQGIISLQNGNIENPFRTVIDIPKYEASALYMPSADFAEHKTATKVVTIFPQNPAVNKPTTQGVILLSDGKNGEHLSVMGASYLTRLRTGALSAIATNKLARKDATTLGVIGTGGMAFEQVLGVLEVRHIQEIILFNRTTDKAYLFKQKLQEYGVTTDIQIVENVDELVKQAHIINCATRSNSPVFNGELLQEGTHINGVGSYLPTMREVDVTTLTRSAIILVDDLHGVKEEAGEFIHADADQTVDWSFANIDSSLKEITINDELLRQSDKDITFFKSVGAAYFDLIVANGTYKKAKQQSFGQEISLD